MVKAVPDRVILEEELRRQGRIGVERDGRGVIQLLVGERAYGIGGLLGVLLRLVTD